MNCFKVVISFLFLVVHISALRRTGLFGERYMFIARPKRIFIDSDSEFPTTRALCLKSFAGVYFPDYCSDD